MRRDAAEARLAKNSGSSSSRRREERMEARRSRRLQVPHTHTHILLKFLSEQGTCWAEEREGPKMLVQGR